jgi:RimJ/RimL family protein N-acetyltransferase
LRIPPLTTERLIVREFGEDDLPVAEALYGTGRERWLRWTLLAYEQLADLGQPPYGDRAVELRESGVVVGAAGLVPLLAPFGLLPSFGGVDERFRPQVGLFYAVLPEHRRRGYATEAAKALLDHAFTELRLGRVVATTTRENEGSIGVMRRLGMRVEHNPAPGPAWFQVVGIADAAGSERPGGTMGLWP